jgi:hypothetical protein
MYVIAPKTGGLAAHLVVNINTTTLIAERDEHFTFDGPGVYAVTATGVRLATAADGAVLPSGYPFVTSAAPASAPH